MPDISVSTPRDLIREVIVTWEGRVHGWHGTIDPDGGNGYGILGFRYVWFKRVVDRYNAIAGKAVGYGDADSLTVLAETGAMIQAQNDVADRYLQQAFDLSIAPRNISSIVGQLVVCDIDVNNGLGNHILAAADVQSGLAESGDDYHKPHLELEGHQEADWLKLVCAERSREIGHLFARYPGLKVRYDWYAQLVDMAADDLNLLDLRVLDIAPKAFSIGKQF